MIVDDGSTDSTLSIIETHAAEDSRIRPFARPASGLAAALNHALHEARAPLAARLDADDIALPKRLALQHAEFQKHEDLGLLGSWAEKIDESGNSAGALRPPTDNADLLNLLQKDNPFIHSTVMFRTVLARRLGAYRDFFRGAEDYDLWLRLAEISRVANLPEILAGYRWHTSNVTQRQPVRQAFSVRLAKTAAQERALHDGDFVDPAMPASEDSVPGGAELYGKDIRIFRLLSFADNAKIATTKRSAIDVTPEDLRELSSRERKLLGLAIANLLRTGHAQMAFDKATLLRICLRVKFPAGFFLFFRATLKILSAARVSNGG